MAKKPKVFIDGEAGTTGLQIAGRLAALGSVEVLSIPTAKRKDLNARAELMARSDCIILCLPDDAAKDAVKLAETLGSRTPKIIDASTAHRVAAGWVYGFAELSPGNREAIANAKRVTNPGCYPTGAIALLRPLVDARLLPADYPVTVNAVSGYSGGGRSMIEAYEADTAPSFELYALGLDHKHVPELMAYSGVKRRPIFVPSVGNFRQGMLVSIPLHLDLLPGKPTQSDIENTLAARYHGSTHLSVIKAPSNVMTRLEAEELNDTDKIELYVFGKPDFHQAVLVARLDNLGKGAAGAAVQNLEIMLGLDVKARA